MVQNLFWFDLWCRRCHFIAAWAKQVFAVWIHSLCSLRNTAVGIAFSDMTTFEVQNANLKACWLKQNLHLTNDSRLRTYIWPMRVAYELTFDQW